MPRKPLDDPPRKITLSVPSSIMAQIELRLYDPVAGTIKYGAVSTLVATLLRGWVSEQNNEVVNTPLTTTSEKGTNDGHDNFGPSEYNPPTSTGR